MRDTYHEELETLTDRVVEMTRLVRSAMSRATTALLDADVSLAESVMSSDAEVNLLDDEIEDATLDVMARQQPVAGDLRMLVTTMRMSQDLERMGDLAVHIAKIARRRHPESAIPAELRATILQMGQVAERLITKAGSVIASRDVMTAMELQHDDDEMDRLRLELFRRLLSDWKHGVEAAIDVTLAGRFYERYADHAVQVASDLVFLVTGQRARDFNPDEHPATPSAAES